MRCTHTLRIRFAYALGFLFLTLAGSHYPAGNRRAEHSLHARHCEHAVYPSRFECARSAPRNPDYTAFFVEFMIRSAARSHLDDRLLRGASRLFLDREKGCRLYHAKSSSCAEPYSSPHRSAAFCSRLLRVGW